MQFRNDGWKLTCTYILIISILIFPNLILFIIPYPIYDGMRLFLWSLPYLCVIPALSIYYLYQNLNFLWLKIYSSIVIFATIFFLYNFMYFPLNVLYNKKSKFQGLSKLFFIILIDIFGFLDNSFQLLVCLTLLP